MFGPPAYPSLPPPKEGDPTKPMGFFAGALWVAGATLAFLWIATLLTALNKSASTDQLLLVGCQATAYLFVLFLMLRMYAPERRIRDFIAFRSTHHAIYPLALIMGVSCTFPAEWVFEIVLQRWPPPKELGFNELFFAADPSRRYAIAIAVVGVGPIFEELLFRGALFTPLAKQNRTSLVIVATSLFFALIHPDPRSIVPIFPLALMLGYLRAASGSLVPPILMHMGFNGQGIFDLLQRDKPPDATEHVTGSASLMGAAVCITALACVVAIAKFSAAAREARQHGE